MQFPGTHVLHHSLSPAILFIFTYSSFFLFFELLFPAFKSLFSSFTSLIAFFRSVNISSLGLPARFSPPFSLPSYPSITHFLSAHVLSNSSFSVLLFCSDISLHSPLPIPHHFVFYPSSLFFPIPSITTSPVLATY